MIGTSSLARHVVLGVALFGATVLILLGLATVVSRLAASPTGSPEAAAVPTIRPSSMPSASSVGSGRVSPTASPSATHEPDPTLVGAGDIADCASDGDEATAALLDRIAGTVFTAGDNVYPSGSAETFRDCFAPSWGRHLDRIRPAPGNHDWESGELTAYLDYFGADGADGRPWYAYELGTWQVIVLDSDCDRVDGCGAESPQGRWLDATLADSRARCTLAIWHHPRFSSGMHGDTAEVAPFWDALYAAGADVVINGHDHDYERFAPQDPNGLEDRARGLREFVVGTGGVALRPFERVAPNSELRVAVAHGVLALTLHDGGYDWQFYPTSTDFSDRGTARCH